MSDSTRIPPDTKDWTWTLEHRCPDCELAAGEVPATDVVHALERALATWPEVLQRAEVHIRRDPARWSDLEYACHVRDVCGVFTRRLQQLRQEDNPIFAAWDQDETAREGEYSRQTPSAVATELTASGRRKAAASPRWPQRKRGNPAVARRLALQVAHQLPWLAGESPRRLAPALTRVRDVFSGPDRTGSTERIG